MAVDRNLMTYCNVLQTFGVFAEETEQFRSRFADDEAFQRRVAVLDRLALINKGALYAAASLARQFGAQSRQYQRLIEVHDNDPDMQRRMKTLGELIDRCNPPETAPAPEI